MVLLQRFSFIWILVSSLRMSGGQDGTGSQVWLTVSSRVDRRGIFSTKWIQRELQLNWKSIPLASATWIGLFESLPGPTMTTTPPAIYKLTDLGSSSGLHKTNIEFPVIQFNQTHLKRSQCLGFFVAWIEGDEVRLVNCIKSQPNWMESMIHRISEKSIISLMIPGTHNSGSYSIGYEVNLISKLLNSYTLCQDESVFNQLVYGNRYLDLRVRYDEDRGEKFWIAHDVYPINKTVREILVQVKQFLDSTSSEIVILDFHRFPVGFDSKAGINMTRHLELLEMIESILGPHLAENKGLSYGRKVGSLVADGRRLVIGHAEAYRLEKSYLFTGVKQIWGQTDSAKNLKSYFTNNLCEPYSIAYSAMAQLTPMASKLLVYGGLRKLAFTINPLVTDWFSNDPELNRCANIVATDYFLGNNVIEVAINANKNR